MPTAPTPITPYATPPSSSDPANFDARADAKVADDVVKVGEYNALATNVYGNAVEANASTVAAAASAAAASSSQSAAASSAAAAAASSGAIAWVSGATYAVGDPRWSPISGRVYRRRTSGAGTTDPSADPTNWALVMTASLQMLIVSGTTQTASVGGLYVLRSASQTTLTAPPSPQPGDTFGVKNGTGRSDCLIDWNGAKHEGLSDSTMKLHRAGIAMQFIYIDSTYGWGIL